MQAPTAEVRVEMEAPPEMDEGMYNCSPNSIIRYLISFVVFVSPWIVISIPEHALHNYYIRDI